MSRLLELITPQKAAAKTTQDTVYSAVHDQSSHGLKNNHLFSIEDQEDEGQTAVSDDIESSRSSGSSSRGAEKLHNLYGQFSGLSLWSMLTFAWIEPLLIKGRTKALDLEDLYEIPAEDSAKAISYKFSRAWQEQLSAGNEFKPSLALALGKAFGRPFLFAGCLKLVHDSTMFLGPWLLSGFIEYLSATGRKGGWGVGLSYVAGMMLVNLCMSICLRQVNYRNYHNDRHFSEK